MSLLDRARDAPASGPQTVQHVVHNLRQVFDVLAEETSAPPPSHTAAAAAASTSSGTGGRNGSLLSIMISRVVFATFVRACGLVRGELTQSTVNMVFNAALAASGTPAKLQPDWLHDSTTPMMTADAFITAVLSCVQVASPGVAIEVGLVHDGVRCATAVQCALC